MNVTSLILQPWKVGEIIGISARFHAKPDQELVLFFMPKLVSFLKEQFFAVDRRFDVDGNEEAFGARIREFVAIRAHLVPPAVDPNSIVKDIRIDERKIPLIMEVVNSKGATFKLEFDEVAIHGLVAELADNDLATLGVQGHG